METASAAPTASPALSEGIERDAIAAFEIGDARADLDHFAGRFVAKNDREPRDHLLCAEFPINDMQVGAAYPARADANQQRALSGRRHWIVDLFSAWCRASLCDRFEVRTLRVPSIRRRGGS